MNMVALVPARRGSKRVPRKNLRVLAGTPLLAYTVAAARESGVFSAVACSTEDTETGLLAALYGARWVTRSRQHATDASPDIDWVREILCPFPEAAPFAILRPPSPFRTAATIRRAYDEFRRRDVDSIRAVQLATEHPAKQWTWAGPGAPLVPVLPGYTNAPWHSSPTQTLTPTYVQNASLEMAWAYVVRDQGTISGKKIAPFFTEGYEGYNIDTEAQFIEAERLIAEGLVDVLPPMGVAGVPPATPPI